MQSADKIVVIQYCVSVALVGYFAFWQLREHRCYSRGIHTISAFLVREESGCTLSSSFTLLSYFSLPIYHKRANLILTSSMDAEKAYILALREEKSLSLKYAGD